MRGNYSGATRRDLMACIEEDIWNQTRAKRKNLCYFNRIGRFACFNCNSKTDIVDQYISLGHDVRDHVIQLRCPIGEHTIQWAMRERTLNEGWRWSGYIHRQAC